MDVPPRPEIHPEIKAGTPGDDKKSKGNDPNSERCKYMISRLELA